MDSQVNIYCNGLYTTNEKNLTDRPDRQVIYIAWFHTVKD